MDYISKLIALFTIFLTAILIVLSFDDELSNSTAWLWFMILFQIMPVITFLLTGKKRHPSYLRVFLLAFVPSCLSLLCLKSFWLFYGSTGIEPFTSERIELLLLVIAALAVCSAIIAFAGIKISKKFSS